MSFYDLLADGYWVYKRTRVPAFVEALTGAKPGSVRPFVPELVKEGIHERKEVLLYLLVRSLRPERIVETGVWYGWSSRAILTALHANARGQLTSIDLPTTGTGRTYSDGTFDPTAGCTSGASCSSAASGSITAASLRYSTPISSNASSAI